MPYIYEMLVLYPSPTKYSVVHLNSRTGQHNDARMNLAIALTAARLGANTVNHVKVTELIKEQSADGKALVRGARLKDMITGFFDNLLFSLFQQCFLGTVNFRFFRQGMECKSKMCNQRYWPVY